MRELFPHIGYKDGELYVEEVRVKEIVKKVGTPVYIYSRRAIEEAFLEFEEAFRAVS